MIPPDRDYDNRAAYALGYRPQDSSAPYEAEVLREDPLPEPGSAAARSAAEVSLVLQLHHLRSIMRLGCLGLVASSPP
jgi:hypothetical protein